MKDKNLTLVILICGLALSTLTGCNSDDSAIEYIIPVVNRCNEPFSFDDYFKKENTVCVNFDDEYPVAAMIHDVFFTDEYAFILDIVNRNLSKIDLEKGKVVNQIQVKRNQTVLSGDDEHLYLLRCGNVDIIYEYDMDLTPIDSFKLKNVYASSFSRIKDGFIFLNARETKNKGRYVITNSNITKAVSYKKLGERPKTYDKFDPIMIISSEVFIRDSHGKVLCFDFENNDGYMYDGKNLKRLFHIGTDVSDPAAVPLKNMQVIYSLNGNILFHYYNEDGTDGVAYFDKNNNLVAQGPSYDTGAEGLFRYTFRQVGKKLVRIRMEMPEERGEYPYKSTQAQIDFYRLK